MFKLPPATKVEKIIPNNAFDHITDEAQKKAFTDMVSRITWRNRIALETVHLLGRDIKEITTNRLKKIK